jgi:ADP-glucose pyrophosphorylase
MKKKIRDYLNRNIGVIVNVNNTTLKNEGGFIHIIIPKSEFENNTKIVNESKMTKHLMKEGVIIKGKSVLEMKRGDGFFIKELD